MTQCDTIVCVFNMLVWIEGSLNPDNLKEKVLKDPTFHEKIIKVLEDVISTSVPSDPDCNLSVPATEFDPCPIRGLNKGLDYDLMLDEEQKDLHYLVKRCQCHVHNSTCYIYWRGPPDPKECCFELDSENFNLHTMFDISTGELCYQHIDEMINNYNSMFLQAVHCNIDIKFIGSGSSAKAIIFYITDYVAKNQLKGHIAYALLELAIQKIEQLESTSNDIKIWGKQLLQKCAHTFISQQELL